MNTAQKISRNASLAMVGSIFNQVCFFVVAVAMGRRLGEEAFGIYSFAMSFSYIFAVLSNGGLSIILVREVARDPEKAGLYIGNMMLIKLALSVVSLALLSGVMALMDLSPLKIKVLYIVAVANVLHFDGRLAIAAFRAFERMAWEGVLLALQGVILLLLALGALYVKPSLVAVVVGLLISYVVMVLVGYLLVGKYLARPRFRIDLDLSKFVIREGIPIGLSAFLIMSYGRIAVIAVEVFRSAPEVGLFSTAFSLTRNLSFIPLVVSGALLPYFSRLALGARTELSMAYARTFKYFFALAIPVGVGGTFLARSVILLFFGPDFEGAAGALQIVSWSPLFVFLGRAVKTTLEAIDRQALWTRTLAVGLLASAGLHIILVPRWGIVGASVALLLGDIMVFALSSHLLGRHLSLPAKIIAMSVLKCLASAGLMGAVLYFLAGWHLVLSGGLGCLAYGLSLLLFRVLDHKEISVLRSMIFTSRQTRWRLGFEPKGAEEKESL